MICSSPPPTGDGSWLIYGQSGQATPMQGNVTLPADLTIDSGNTLTIPAGSTLNLSGHTLTVNGTLTIANQSSLAGSGTLAGDSGTYTMTNPDPVITGSDTLTYDGTDHFNDFSLTAPHRHGGGDGEGPYHLRLPQLGGLEPGNAGNHQCGNLHPDRQKFRRHPHHRERGHGRAR